MAEETPAPEKIASVLGLLLVKDMGTIDKIATLESCGFSVKEISRLTGSNEKTVHARLSDARKRAAAKPAPRAGTKSTDG